MSDESPPKGDAKPTEPKAQTPNAQNDKIDSVAERVIAALVKINRANRKADAAEHKRNDSREKRRFIVEIIEIGLILVYATFTILEWHVFSGESVTMENEFKTSQANATAQLAAIEKQNNEIQETRFVDERAWVFVETPDNSFIADPTNCVENATFKNSGKTPAFVTGTWGEVTVNTNSIKTIDPQVGGMALMVTPNSRGGIIKITFPTPFLIAANSSNQPVYIFGTVWYDDIFGKHHWTQFCFALTDMGNVMILQNFHNSCDDAQTNQTN